MRNLIKTFLVMLMLSFSHAALAGSILGPSNYEDCILENMKDVASDLAAKSIMRACYEKFPNRKKTVVDTLENFRKARPELNKFSDAQLATYLYKKYGQGMDKNEFARQLKGER